MLKFKSVQKFGNTRLKLRIGDISAEPKIQPHPLFQQVKQIELKNDELNVKCLQLIIKGEVSIEAQKSKVFVQRCRQILDFEPVVDIEQLSVGLFVNNGEGIGNILDYLEFGDLLSVLKFSFEKTVQKSHGRILRKVKNYLKGSGRKQGQKQTLQNLLKLYKQSEKILQDEIQNPGEKQASMKNGLADNRKQEAQMKVKISESRRQEGKEDKKVPAMQKNKILKQEGFQNSENQVEKELASIIGTKSAPTKNVKKSRQEGFNDLKAPNNDKKQSRKTSYSKRDNYSRDRKNEESKEKRDPKIYLAINGDTQSGWRERYRPPRVPQYKKFQKRQYKKQIKQQDVFQTKQTLKQINNPKQKYATPQPLANPQTQTKKQDKPDQNSSPRLVYSYPEDGDNFNISPYKNSFKCLVNNNFWVEFNGGVLKIMKGENGYIRDSSIDVLDKGFLAQGLTLRLGSLSNIEDGGEIIGNPNIQELTGNTTQFFNVEKLKVYSGLTGNKQDYGAKKESTKKESKIENDNELDCQYEESREERQSRLAKQKSNLSEKRIPQEKGKQIKSQNEDEQKEEEEGKQSMGNKREQNSNQQDWEEEQEHRVASGKHAKKEKKKGKKQNKENKGKLLGDELTKGKKDEKEEGENSQQKTHKRNKSKSKKHQQTGTKSATMKQKSSQGNEQDQKQKILLGIKGGTQHRQGQPNRNNEKVQQHIQDVSQKVKEKKNRKKHKKSNSAVKSQAQQEKKIQETSQHPPKTNFQESCTKPSDSSIQDNSYILIFEFPKDGATFDFSQLGEDFHLFVNKSFWVNYKDGTMVIKKGENGFIRKSKIDFINNGFLSQGITFKLDGTSNIQDGGQEIGMPVISDFTGSDAQFYHISSVHIYKKRE